MTAPTSRDIHHLADRLSRAAATGVPCGPVRDVIARDDVETAYRIQTVNIEAAVAAGRRVIGRKIGLTSPAVQAQLGVDQPDFGVLLDDMDVSGEAAVDMARLMQPRIEAEVAMELSADILTPISAADAPNCVGRLSAAFEIVDSRISGWDITLADTVADNASSGLFVLGDSVERADWPDLAAITMTMSEDGRDVSAGKGSDCLGSPWEALVWLANTALSYSSPLRRGDVVLSGALGPMVPVASGSTYVASITGIGDVAATFGS